MTRTILCAVAAMLSPSAAAQTGLSVGDLLRAEHLRALEVQAKHYGADFERATAERARVLATLSYEAEARAEACPENDLGSYTELDALLEVRARVERRIEAESHRYAPRHPVMVLLRSDADLITQEIIKLLAAMTCVTVQLRQIEAERR